MRLLVISGGRHPYEESTPVLDGFLKRAGHDVSVHWTTEILTADSIIDNFDEQAGANYFNISDIEDKINIKE